MYYKVYGRHNGHWDPLYVSGMTKTELKRAKRNYTARLYLAITGAEAHAWVRKGGIHNTRLYVDQDKRVRRAG